MNETRAAGRARESARRWRVVLGVLAAPPLGLAEAPARELLRGAELDRSVRLGRLARHLATEPNALVSGNPRCPVEIMWLVEALAERGSTVVVRPGCSDCGTTARPLNRTGPGGRLCRLCGVKASMRACSRCSKVAKIEFRSSSGEGLCRMCGPAPLRTCTACGRQARSAVVDEDGGSLCHSCYARERQPKRACGVCGQVRIIARRGRDGEPDVCRACRREPVRECEECGRQVACRGVFTGRWRCRLCSEAPRSTCAGCGRVRRINANWPLGPVCTSCYSRVLRHPGPCSACAAALPLVGLDLEGRAVCGPCAGRPDLDFTCATCGRRGHRYYKGRCAHCALTERINATLSGPDGGIPDQLAGFARALGTAPDTYTALRWLERSPNAQLLGRLVRENRALSHELLDELPIGRYEHFVRNLLVAHHVLEPRDEQIERIAPWLEDVLASRPTHHARLMRPFLNWFLLPRARRRTRVRKQPAEPSSYLRTRVLAALKLLDHLDGRGTVLADLRQDMLDGWLVDSGRTQSSYQVRYFLDWAHRQGLAPELTVPPAQTLTPTPALAEDECLALLRRCIDDESLPLDARAIGALVLLYGLTAVRIRFLKISQLHTDGTRDLLATGTHPLVLPTRVADLLRRHAQSPKAHPALPGCQEPGPWLFPGQIPGRPLTAITIGRKLDLIGIPASAARHTALITLAADIPAPILADVLGMHYDTAVKWARISQSDWATYLHARANSRTEGGR